MNDLDDVLADDLRRLFADERLSIPPADGAERVVAAGARRTRRRREFAVLGSGSIAAASLLVVGMLFVRPPVNGGNDDIVALPPRATQDVTSAAPTTTSSSKKRPPTPTRTTVIHIPGQPSPGAPGDVPPAWPDDPLPSGGEEGDNDQPQIMPASLQIGPDGYRDLRLGMSFDEASSTGMLAEGSEPPSGCTSYQLAEGGETVTSVLISDTQGLVRVDASNEGRSPEGRGVGSTMEELKETYPSGSEDESGFVASSGQGGVYRFLVGDGVTYEFYLHTETKYDCGQ